MKNNIWVAIFALAFAFCGCSEKGTAVIDMNSSESYENTLSDAVQEDLARRYSYVPQQTSMSEGILKVSNNGKWGFVNNKGQEIVSCKYKSVLAYSEGMAAVCVQRNYVNFCGYVDRNGKEIIPCKYKEVSSFVNGYAKVSEEFGTYGLIDKNGKLVVPCKYSEVDLLHSSLVRVAVGEYYKRKVGVVDMSGNEVVACEYQDIWCVANGMIGVKKNDKYGLLNSEGHVVVPCKYDRIVFGTPFDNADVPAPVKEEWADAVVAPFVSFGQLAASNEDFYEGRAFVCIDRRCGMIDETGKEIIPCRYDRIAYLCPGYVMVGLGEYPTKYGLITTQGETVTGIKFDRMELWGNDMLCVGVAGNGYRFGLYDLKGEEVVPMKYMSIGELVNGVAIVAVRGQYIGDELYGLIDSTGNEILACKYQNLQMLGNGVVKAKLRNAYGLIDFQGNEIAPMKYYSIGNFVDGLAIVATARDPYTPDKYGFMNAKGELVIPCEYEIVNPFENGIAKVRLNGEWQFIDKEGNVK